MAILDAQYIIQNKSFEPKNAVVNTWHFLTPGPVATDLELDAVVADLRTFYDQVTTNNIAVSNLMSAQVAANLRRIKVFKRYEPKPRLPARDVTFTGAGNAGAGFPNEVALVLSSRSQPLSGVPQRRRRGRVYIGPLSDDSPYVERGGNDVRPSALARNTIANAALRLVDSVSGVIWATVSTVDNVASPVIGGFVDNAYDTQRRRGVDSTTRSVF